MNNVITISFTHSCDIGDIHMGTFTFSFWGEVDQVAPDLTEEGGEDMQSLFKALKRTLKNRYLMTTAFVPRWMVDTFRLLQYCNQVTGECYDESFTMSKIDVSVDWDMPQADFALVTIEFDRKEQIVQGRCCDSVEFTNDSTWGTPLCEQHFVEWDSAWGTPLCEQEEITWDSTWGTLLCEQVKDEIEIEVDITWTDSSQGADDGFGSFLYLRDDENNIIDDHEFVGINKAGNVKLTAPGGEEYQVDFNSLLAYIDGISVSPFNVRWRVAPAGFTESMTTDFYDDDTIVEVEIQVDNF